jgi:hypothetical protein
MKQFNIYKKHSNLARYHFEVYGILLFIWILKNKKLDSNFAGCTRINKQKLL